MKNYYTVLGVEPDADENTIRQKYRSLAKQYHPDLHPGDTQMEERFKEIGEAYEVLGDSKKRSEYDTKLKKHQRPASGPRRAPASGKVDFDDLMNRFDSFFGSAVQPPAGAEKQKNPLDASELFESYMGFGKKKSK